MRQAHFFESRVFVLKFFSAIYDSYVSLRLVDVIQSESLIDLQHVAFD